MMISTPGRICLFGEHQDYLGLPIISMAISLRCTLMGERIQNKIIIIYKPQVAETESFFLDDITYTKPRDYFKSGIKVCLEAGLTFSQGLECEINSQIPIRAGNGSSSAIMVSWIHFLTKMADEPVCWDRQKIGQLAYQAEVLEFSEPGGMMDHYSTALGGLIYLESKPDISIEHLYAKLGTFVLGDSDEPKNTLGILRRCRDKRIKIMEKLRRLYSNFDLHQFELMNNLDIQKYLLEDETELLKGTLENRNFLRRALQEFRKEKPNHELIGQLLTGHHKVLRDVLKVSTPKIETMLDAAIKAGALGGKINGSGGGGCMFAYCPEDPETVVTAIENVGGNAYIINQSEGTREDRI